MRQDKVQTPSLFFSMLVAVLLLTCSVITSSQANENAIPVDEFPTNLWTYNIYTQQYSPPGFNKIIHLAERGYIPIYSERSGTASIIQESGYYVTIKVVYGDGTFSTHSPIVKASINPRFYETYCAEYSTGWHNQTCIRHEKRLTSFSTGNHTLLGFKPSSDLFEEFYDENVDIAEQSAESLDIGEPTSTGAIPPPETPDVLYTVEEHDGTSADPTLQVTGNEESEYLNQVGENPYCDETTRQAITQQREKSVQTKEGVRNINLSAVTRFLDMSCFDNYQFEMFNNVANTFSNTSGFFNSAISSITSGAFSDFAQNAACNATKDFVNSYAQNSGAKINGLYSAQYNQLGETKWGEHLQRKIPPSPEQHLNSSALNRYYDESKAYFEKIRMRNEQ